ncbi:hypothetical protein SAMN02910339_00336 [Lachnospiraceae bacterium YSD2013]|nr:hypothetical protein SAMN02910339_00336 [Lachnospiraceae bacterium YSD2013]
MLKIEKIEDKSLNLDVQGQGCWDDCFIGEHWEAKSDFKTNGCSWHNDNYTAASCIIF